MLPLEFIFSILLERFYFASSADLLDILSNGNNPPKVAKHLTKLFDRYILLHMVSINIVTCAYCSIAKLKMLEEEGGKLVKVAHTMVAKDGEVKKDKTFQR